MRIGVISPISWLPTLQHENYHLILVSQVLQSPAYAEYYHNCLKNGQVVLLDNDAYETGVSAPLQNIYDAAKLILGGNIREYCAPTLYVIFPDALRDASKTGTLISRHGEEMVRKFHPETRFAAVPQGTSFEQWTICAQSIQFMVGEYLSLICIPRCLEEATDVSNPIREAAWYLYDNDFPPVHMLGLGNKPSLWRGIGNHTNVMGIDTAELMNRIVCSCALSIKDLRYVDDLFIPEVKRHPNFFELPYDEIIDYQQLLPHYLQAMHNFLEG